LNTGTDPIVSSIDSVLNAGDLVNLMLANNVTLQASDFITVATAITSTSNNNLVLDTTTLNLQAPIQLGTGTLSGTAITANVSGTGLIQNAVNATSTVTAPTVNLAAGTYHEHDIVINKPMTISGSGSANTVVDADQIGRVFRVTSSSAGTVTIDGMMITGGLATTTSLGVANPRAAAGGGILLHNGARLVLSNSVVTDNEARGTPTTTAHAFASGGGIYVVAGGNLTIEDSQITGNRATASSTVTIAGNTNTFAFGGGIYIATGIASSRLTISGNSVISGNSALADSSASANTANSVAQGGGIYLAGSGIFNLGAATIAGNSALARSSASPSSVSTAEGGGIYATGTGTLTLPGTLVLNNSAAATSNSTGTSSNLKANVHGGGVFLSNGTYTISNGTHINGNTATARATPGDVSDGYAESFGGGLYAFNAAKLQISDAEINTNTALATTTSGHGLSMTTYAEGGGLYIQSTAAGTYTIAGSHIYANAATANSSNSAASSVDVSSLANSYGGGLYFFNGGTLTLSSTEIADNRSNSSASVGTGDVTTASTARAESYGGGLYLQNGSFTITSSALYRNGGTAVTSNGSSSPGKVSQNVMLGGGLAIGTLTTLQSVTLQNVTLNRNTAQYGGAIAWFGDLGSVTLDSVTVAGNSVSIRGGGIYRGNPSGTALTGALTITNSIVATNTGAASTDGPDASGQFADGGSNLIGITDGSTGFGSGSTPSNVTLLGTAASPVDPMLTPLGLYGGSTRTMALQAGSPALDAGFTSLLSDQRGIGRPQGSLADIGAFESTGILYTLTYVATSGSGQQAILGHAFTNPLVVTLTADFGFDISGTPISLLVPLSGPTASGVLTQTVDSSGIARFYLTAEGVIGMYTVGISGVSPSPTTTFSLENLAIPLIVTPNFITKIIGQGDPALTYNVTPALYGSDTLSGILTGNLARTAGEALGRYDILQNTLALLPSALSRYTLTFASGEDQFLVAASTVTPPPVVPPVVVTPPVVTPSEPGVPTTPGVPPRGVDSAPPSTGTVQTKPDSARLAEFDATRGRNDTEDPRQRKKAVRTPKVTYVVRPFVVPDATLHDSSFDAFADPQVRTSRGQRNTRPIR
ncbi:MAG TPA: choice-of-anchor Q domain-containing protein, partial [Candidatus Methylacidiphilales bacterium]|nr:choice-of-anchor Q domain-containing protein [Candidatus Methylacidiphilales bacterium]